MRALRLTLPLLCCVLAVPMLALTPSCAQRVPPDDATVSDAGTEAGDNLDGGPRGGARDAGDVAEEPARPWPEPDPFASQPDVSEGLTNTSADLDALLENGALTTACASWEADRTNQRKKLLCGKAMFFYEGFGGIGVPSGLFDFFGNEFPEITGTAWEGFGLVPDPFHPIPARPLGVGTGAPLGTVPTLAYTCASCHFGRLPDGRYSVGAPNHAYEYGRQLLAIALPAGSLSPGFDPGEHHPDAIAAVQPFIDALDADRGLRLRLVLDLLPLIGTAQPTFDMETEGHYAHWLSGTLDFMMAPLPLEDEIHTVSKILSLWGLATPEETDAAGMEHEQLAWTGGADSLMTFLRGFVAIGDGSAAVWPDERLEPLRDYLLSLRAPANPAMPARDVVERGRRVFAAADCLDCHDGPRGMGRELYTFEELGTDDAMRGWGDPELDGVLCCDFNGPATHKIKSPRLVGLWAQQRFLHNGSVASLEELLCLTPRTPDTRPAQGSGGHLYGCELGESERRDLVAFLNTL